MSNLKLTSPEGVARIEEMVSRLALFPLSAEVNSQGHLVIGGGDCVALADEFGTPLYLFDEYTLRCKCAELKKEFGQRYAETEVIYAGKAFISRALAMLLMEEGLGLDVVSAGELNIARSVGFPLERVYLHGNNKSAEELGLALEFNIGRIVVDNFAELTRLGKMAEERCCTPDILLRLTPGVEPHTHKYIVTGAIDSKFGFASAQWGEAVSQAMAAPNLNLVGLHFHIGSLIYETEPYQKSIELLLDFAAEAKAKYGFELKELNAGGGFAIQYTLDLPAPPIAAYAEAIASKIKDKCQELKLALPRLIVEPGRSVVGQAGVALYRVGVVKDVPGIRRYVSVDGGIGDNIRPALYQARYEAVVANKMSAQDADEVTIAGRFCESGDILIRDIKLPSVSPGDIIAIPASGAYSLPMASNYNAVPRPAVAMVRDGKARLIRQRETFEDLIRDDLC
jgi:diaminopimelate decarboxylase